ncbi:MAG: DUF1844 domain-containing protein [Verrucomicrobiota bacterium]
MNEESLDGATLEEIHAALFLQLVAGHAQTALVLLGQAENPHTGTVEAIQLEGAKIFLDHLEMLEVKTRGNLGALEADALRQALDVVRTAFARELDAQLRDPSAEERQPPAGGVR